ncbi:LysE family transporter [Xylophilus sp.]|uniref:LysE family transporter n=1 Tax=Xylophilus sp. TaxID=2653893 RepID=UPI0013BC8E13|nr:LysE family transporter [Xylophilus sp.]KAF1043736.1 MAG: Homoserine/homoserine lactone efflux protein [Xylophilus sp.]
MDLHLWTAYLIACLLIAVSPGSGAVLSMSHGMAYGVRRTSVTIAGLQIGLAAVLLTAGAGVGSLLVASEIGFNIVKTLGALYLIWIGFRQWTEKVQAPDEGADALPAAAAPGWRGRLAIGFLTNVTNPKGILFMVAVLPQFIRPDRPLALQLLVMTVTMCGVDTLVMHGYAFAGGGLQRLLRNARAAKVRNRVFGGLLMGVGAGLFFVKRHHGV